MDLFRRENQGIAYVATIEGPMSRLPLLLHLRYHFRLH